MGFSKERQLPQLTHVEVLKKEMTEQSAEALFCIGKTQTHISKTLSVHNPFEFQKRDAERPIQRKIYSIPPRLAKIMVNLSVCMPGKTLLDPFCGVGTILQEALLLNAHVIGVDINPWCVNASLTNLDWLTNEYHLKESKYEVFKGDSRDLKNLFNKETIDCIVTEPDLGPPLRHFPTDSYATRITNKLKSLYCSFLKGAYEALRSEGYIVFVTPYVKTRSDSFITLNLEEEVKALGFRSVYPYNPKMFEDRDSLVERLASMASFIDIRKTHKIGRKINILQK
jgi:tRNA G10  N-methylase Trm11